MMLFGRVHADVDHKRAGVASLPFLAIVLWERF